MTARSIFHVNDEIAEVRGQIDRTTGELLTVTEQDTPGHRRRAVNRERSLEHLHRQLRELETERDGELARLTSTPAKLEAATPSATPRRSSGEATRGRPPGPTLRPTTSVPAG